MEAGRAVTALLQLVGYACGRDVTEPLPVIPMTGSLSISLVRAPRTPALLISATVRVGETSVRVKNDTRQSFELTPGSHRVEAYGPTPSCRVQGENPKTVTIAAGQATQTSFEIACTFEPEPRIVFVWEKPGYLTDDWSVRTDGTDLRQLTHDGESALPRWSPDGTGSCMRELETISGS